MRKKKKIGDGKKELQENFMLCALRQRLALLGRICQTEWAGRNVNIGQTKKAYKSSVRKFET